MTTTDDHERRMGYVDPAALNALNASDAPTSPVTEPPDGAECNVITSQIEGGWAWEGIQHRPVLDIDFPARLIPSSTPGHFHLYLDGVRVPHAAYMDLLAALTRAGIIGPGYADHSMERGFTCVRIPGDHKPAMTDPSHEGMTRQP